MTGAYCRRVYSRRSYALVVYMRTNIMIDAKLIAEAMRATGARSKREAVELGLRALVRLKKQKEIRGFRGKLKWRGDLGRMRAD